MRAVARKVLGPGQVSGSSATLSRSGSVWNEHFILSTLKESTVASSRKGAPRHRVYSTAASASVMEAFIDLVRLKAQQKPSINRFSQDRASASVIATDSYQKLLRNSVLAEIRAANDVGDTKKSSRLIATLYNPRTNLPSSADVWIEQLRIYRFTRQGQAALDALMLHIPICGIVPTHQMYGFVLRALGTAGMGAKILFVLEDMQRRGSAVPASVIYDAIAGLIASNMKSDALKLFGNLQTKFSMKPNALYCQLIVELYCSEDKRAKALSLVEEMWRLQIRPTVGSLSAIACALLNKPTMTAPEIKQAIEEFHTLLDRFQVPVEEIRASGEGFYVFALSCLQSNPELAPELAHHIVQQAWVKRIKFSTSLLNAAMEAYLYAGEVSRSKGLFRDMVLGVTFQGQMRYVSPPQNVNTAASSSDVPADVKNIKYRVVPNDKTLQILLRICNNRREWEAALKYWNLFMNFLQIPLSSKSLGMLVSALCSAGQRDLAMQEIEKATQLLSVEADSWVLAGLVKWCASSNRPDFADNILEAAERANLPMNQTLGTNLLQVYSFTGNLDRAVEVWYKMKKSKATTSTGAAWMLLLIATHYGANKASEFYQEFLSDGGVVTSFLMYTMIRVYTWYGSIESAVEYVDQVQKQFGITPHMNHFSHLLKMCGRAADLEKVCRIFEHYQSQDEWIFTKSFCYQVIATFSSHRIGGMTKGDAQIANSWLQLALKPMRIGLRGATVLGLEKPDKVVFLNMVRGWMAHARRNRNDSAAVPVAPVVPLSDMKDKFKQSQVPEWSGTL